MHNPDVIPSPKMFAVNSTDRTMAVKDVKFVVIAILVEASAVTSSWFRISKK